MKGILEEYGLIIVVVVALAVLILAATGIGGKVKTAIEGTIDKFSTNGNNAIDGI